MSVSTGNADNAAESGHVDRQQRVPGLTCAELALDSLPPGPDRAVRRDREIVARSGRDFDHAGEAGDLYGRSRVIEGSVAERAVEIQAPRPHGAIGFQRDAVTG